MNLSLVHCKCKAASVFQIGQVFMLCKSAFELLLFFYCSSKTEHWHKWLIYNAQPRAWPMCTIYSHTHVPACTQPSVSGTSSQAHKNDSVTYFMGSEGRFFFTGRKTSTQEKLPLIPIPLHLPSRTRPGSRNALTRWFVKTLRTLALVTSYNAVQQETATSAKLPLPPDAQSLKTGCRNASMMDISWPVFRRDISHWLFLSHMKRCWLNNSRWWGHSFTLGSEQCTSVKKRSEFPIRLKTCPGYLWYSTAAAKQKLQRLAQVMKQFAIEDGESGLSDGVSEKSEKESGQERIIGFYSDLFYFDLLAVQHYFYQLHYHFKVLSFIDLCW